MIENVKLKAVLFVVLLILILGIILVFILTNYSFPSSDNIIYSDEITEEDKYCEADNECAFVDLACCPQLNAGTTDIVNQAGKQKIEDWKKENCVQCGGGIFPLVSATSIEASNILVAPKCEQNQCQIKHTPNCQKITALCSEDQGIRENARKLTEWELDLLNMTKEEVLEYCGC